MRGRWEGLMIGGGLACLIGALVGLGWSIGRVDGFADGVTSGWNLAVRNCKADMTVNCKEIEK